MRNSMYKNYTANDLLQMVGKRKFYDYAKDEYLFKENEPVDGVYFLLSGKVNIIKKDSIGKESSLYNLKAPDIICLHTIMEEEYHLSSAIAAERCKVCFVHKSALKKLILDNSTAAINIMRLLCLKINKIENQISGYA